MEIKKLGTICKLKQGFQVPLPEQVTEYKEGFVRFIRIVDYTKNTDDVRYVKDSEKFYYIKPDDVVMVRYGAAGEVGHGISGVIANNMFLIEPTIDINKDYLFYYLSQNKVKHKLLSTSTSTTMPALNFKIVNDLDIPIWDRDKQNNIVVLFDKISKIIADRTQELQLLDNLIKARFVELFGDPIRNPKGWEVVTIGDIVTEVRYGTSKPAVEGGRYPYLRMNNLTADGHLDLTDLKYIDIPDDEIEKCVVRKGDVLFNRTNSIELVGKTAVFDLLEDMIIAGYIIRVRLNEKLLPEVLSQYMNLEAIKDILRSMAKGAVNQANINAQELQSIKVYIPDMELQKHFIEIKKQVDKSKFAVA